MPAIRALGTFGPDEPWSDRLRDALLEWLYQAASNDIFLPLADVFGWRDRVNTPATVSDANWTWRLPWPVDRLSSEPDAVARAAACLALARRTGRAAPVD
jgi:4-alpha-glucanotransferase